MSIRIMTIVWESDLPSSEKFVALALADFANDDGMAIYPSVGRVAWKCGVTDRAVQFNLRKLIERGVLVPMPGKPMDGGRGITREYRLNVRALPRREPFRGKGENISPFTEKGEIDDSERVKSATERVKPTSPDPSSDPSSDPSVLTAVRDLFAEAFNERRGSVAQRRKMERLCRDGVTLEDFKCAITITNEQPRDDGFTYALTVAKGVRDDRISGRLPQAGTREHRGPGRGYARGNGSRGITGYGRGDGRRGGVAVAVPQRASDRLSPEEVAKWADVTSEPVTQAP